MSRKKNKKSFSDNLEMLFQERMHDDNAQDTLALIEDEPAEVQDKSVVVKKPKVKKTIIIEPKNNKNKKKKGKSFANNLQQFFQESLGETDGSEVVEVKTKDVGKGKSRVVGLDLLIRQTTKENIKYKKLMVYQKKKSLLRKRFMIESKEKINL